MSDRDLIARAIYEDDCGRPRPDRPADLSYYRNADAVLAALGATCDDVLVALPRETAEEWATMPTNDFPPSLNQSRTTFDACRAALARGRREPVTVTLDPDVAEAVRRLIGGGSRRNDNGRLILAPALAALDAALGGES